MKTLGLNLRTLILLSLALTFAFLANFAYSQTWSEPDPGGPPNPNAAAPLNVSTEFQAKPGNIMTNELIADTRMRSDLYCDEAGDNCFTPDEVGAGGGGTTFQNVSCTARWQSFMSGPDTCSATCPTDTTLVGCAKTSS